MDLPISHVVGLIVGATVCLSSLLIKLNIHFNTWMTSKTTQQQQDIKLLLEVVTWLSAGVALYSFGTLLFIYHVG
jgi:hypothetical protein